MLIEQARALARTGMKKHLRVLPMYAGLPSFEQMKVFERVSHSVRKVSLLVSDQWCLQPLVITLAPLCTAECCLWFYMY